MFPALKPEPEPAPKLQTSVQAASFRAEGLDGFTLRLKIAKKPFMVGLFWAQKPLNMSPWSLRHLEFRA